MIVIGVLLILVAAGAAAFVLIAPAATSQAIELTAIGVTVNATPLASFVAGAAVVALLGLGFAMVSVGARRNASSRKELRQLRKDQAAAGPSTPAAAGERSSRRAGPQHSSSTDTGSPDTGNTDSRPDTNTDTKTDVSTDTKTDAGTDSRTDINTDTDNSTDFESPSSR